MREHELKYYKWCDLLSAILVWLLFFIFRRLVNDFAIPSDVQRQLIDPSFPLFLSLLFYVSLAMAVHYITGFYNTEWRRSRIKELFNTFSDALLIAIIAFFAMLLDDKVTSYKFFYKSFFLLWALQFTLTYLLRFIITASYFKSVRQGSYPNNILIVGSGLVAKRAAESIEHKIRTYGNVFKGFISYNAKKEVDPSLILADWSQVKSVIHEQQIQTVIIALQESDKEVYFKIINELIPLGVDIYSIPGKLDIVTGSVKIDDIDSDPLVSVTSATMPPWQQSIKRLFDIFVSTFSLLFLSPLFLFVTLRIFFSRNGSVIYSQERIGKHGRPFKIYKFRTMYANAEDGGPQLSSKQDPRITPFGHYLRRYRIDELPQLWNVLKGDMSIVGPRPERSYFIKQILEVAPYYPQILKNEMNHCL